MSRRTFLQNAEASSCDSKRKKKESYSHASFSDLCKVVEDEHTIIKIAFQFWFADEDAPEGKVWIYMCAMHKYKE